MKPIMPSLFLAALCAFSAQASSIPAFSLVPAGGIVSGVSGGVVGWGYVVTNNDPSNYLLLNDSTVTGGLGSGTFGTYLDYIASNFIVVNPNSSTGTVLFSKGISGLGEFDIAAVVPPNTIVPGSIALDYSLFSQNPNSPLFDPGSLIAEGTVSATGQVDANAGTSTVPEPGSMWLTIAALLPLAWAVRLCRRKSSHPCAANTPRPSLPPPWPRSSPLPG
jgi:hypothetical protein